MVPAACCGRSMLARWLAACSSDQSSHPCISWVSDCCSIHPPEPCSSSSETEDEDGWQHVERPAAQLPGQYRSITHVNELSWEDEIQI